MKLLGVFLAYIFANIVSIGLAFGAIYMAINKIDGWGWFLFCSGLFQTGLKYKK